MISRTKKQTEQLGFQLASRLKGGDIVALVGDVGVGKTVFARGIARGLGVCDQITSPTYTIVNQYRGSSLQLFHFDFYRLEGVPFDELGFEEMLASKDAVCVIEWSQFAPGGLVKPTYTIEFELFSESQRRITGEGI